MIESLDKTTIAYIAGSTFAALEVVSLVSVTFFGNAFRRRFPVLARHAGVGVKATSYRFAASMDTMIIAFLMTGQVHVALGIIGFEVLTKFFLYYAHEWLWTTKYFARLTHFVRQHNMNRSDEFAKAMITRSMGG